MQAARIKKDFEQRGYAIVPNVFTPDEMAFAKSEARRCAAEIEPGDPSLQIRNGSPALLFGPNDRSNYLRSLAESERLKSIVRIFLGNEVRQLNNQIYFRESGDEDEFAWHQDICFRTPPEDFANIEAGYLQTIICVDDIDRNGAIEFIPGSHKWGDMKLIPRDNTERGLRKFYRNTWQGEKVRADSGDVLIWSVMVVHGSEKNESGSSRMTFMNGFAREDAVLNKERFSKYL